MLSPKIKRQRDSVVKNIVRCKSTIYFSSHV